MELINQTLAEAKSGGWLEGIANGSSTTDATSPSILTSSGAAIVTPQTGRHT